MKKTVFATILFFLMLSVPFFHPLADDLQNKINDLGSQIQALVQEKNLTQSDYDTAIAKLNSIKSQIAEIEAEIAQKEIEVKKGEQALEYQKNLLNQRVNSYYKNVNKNSLSLITVLVSPNLSDSLRDFFYQKSLVDSDKETIIKVVLYIKNLEEIKANLTQQKASLAALKIQVDQQSQTLASKIGDLSSQISQLVAQQQSLIAQRLAALNLPQSAYTSTSGCSSDLTNGKDPGFSPGFGFFTFGVPHRVGMSQYGAKGRADAGQNAEQILKFYYNADYTTGYNTGVNIHVVGTNEYGQNIDQTLNVEDYLKHIYEMPTDWNMEALKAQAIAARSYVLAATNNGASQICPSQHCQVFKQEENSDAWKQAVSATAGIVMTSGGSPISAYYSSTAGGYVYSSSNSISSRPWTKNAQDGSGSYNNFSDVRNNAYDKSSPWFYCDWGGRSNYGNTAWLKPEEVADIANVIMLVQKDQSTIANVYQVDAPNPAGKDTWNQDRVKQELRNRGGNPFNSVSSVSISADFGSGRVTSVIVSGDAGTQTFSGDDFKTYFDQRAPGNIQIVGPLYNVERR
ncbi:SpoIID/LytB domain-containing protein [Patescibacteria group bacterium]|nr:SpoIID/LytB domain-containing protein [Patescibacteria group bacterium]